jgi:hypothetical protein
MEWCCSEWGVAATNPENIWTGLSFSTHYSKLFDIFYQCKIVEKSVPPTNHSRFPHSIIASTTPHHPRHAHFPREHLVVWPWKTKTFKPLPLSVTDFHSKCDIVILYYKYLKRIVGFDVLNYVPLATALCKTFLLRMLNESWAGRNPTKGCSVDWRRRRCT